MSTNLGAYLDEKVDRYREEPFLFYYERMLSYAEFGRQVDRLAHGLKSLGFRQGDFIHVLVQNSPETLLSYFAIQKIGAVAGPINGWWKAGEIEYLLNDSQGRGLVIEPQYLPLLDEIRGRCPRLEIVVETGGSPRPAHASFEHLLTMTAGRDERFVCRAAPADAAYIFYTSGTTGKPKGVLLSHANVLADIHCFQEAMDLEEGLRILIFLPLFHVNAMLTSVSALDRGGAIVLRKKFSANEHWEVVERYGVSFWSAVPAIYGILLADPAKDRYDKSSLKFAICGAAPMPAETFRQFERTFGIPLVEGYGLTEATCVSTLNPRKGLRKVGSIGKACPGQEVLIVDEEGRELPPGQTGEIVIRGDVVMMGYFNKPQETAEALAGGVLHTGDVGYKDADGYIFIVDRLKDMIIRGGENIYPKEIDNLLVEHPKVRDAACVGVQDPLLGEELKAYVIARAGESLTEEEVRAYCTQRLASYKVPRYVQILEQDFPRNAVGKVLKQEMKRWGVAGPAAPPAAAAVGAEAAPAAPTAARAAPKGPEPGPAAGRGGEVTVADIFATMPARVDPKGVAGLEASFGYRITGEGGGEWTVVASGGKVKILPGIGQPDVVATISAPDWIDLTLGKLDGMTAFTSGKLRAEGQMMLLTKAAKMFKKYAPPAAVIPAAEEQREELVILRQLLSIPQRFSTGPTMGRFLTELRDGKRITGNRCPCCGRIQVPPREVCAVCRVRVEQFLEVGPEGALATWDIAYYASPDPLSGESRETPYCSAFILLDGCRGNDVFWHEIDPADIGRLKKGARVRPIWAERRTGAITDIRFFRIIG